MGGQVMFRLILVASFGVSLVAAMFDNQGRPVRKPQHSGFGYEKSYSKQRLQNASGAALAEVACRKMTEAQEKMENEMTKKYNDSNADVEAMIASRKLEPNELSIALEWRAAYNAKQYWDFKGILDRLNNAIFNR